MSQKILDIILPVYHEQDNITPLLTSIQKYVKTPHKVTIVLQDKKDPTLKKLQRKQKNVAVIFTKNGKGLLKAITEGLNQTKAPIIIIMMADLSDNPKDIDKMVTKIKQGYDLVCASRYSPKGKRNGGPKIKSFLSYIACKSLVFLIKVPTNDATNAFKCFRRTLIEKISFESKEGFELALELTMKAFCNGFIITEIPTIWRDRQKGKSKFSLLYNLPLYLRWYGYGIMMTTKNRFGLTNSKGESKKLKQPKQ